MTKMLIATKLNPLAPEFRPSRIQGLREGKARMETIQGKSGTSHPQNATNSAGNADFYISIMELPPEVICSVLSKLSTIQDALACGTSSKQMLNLLATTDMKLDISTTVSNWPAPSEAPGYLEKLIYSLEKYTPGVAHLDLSNLPVDDQCAGDILVKLPKLQQLVMSGCKKLSSNLVEHLVQQSGIYDGKHAHEPLPDGSCMLKLHSLNLQRCFQLNSSTFTQILKAAARKALPLRCLAMSHLDFSAWPKPEATGTGPLSMPSPNFEEHLKACLSTSSDTTLHAHQKSSVTARNLVVLALNNCNRLTPMTLQTLAATCPNLEFLFLGGSTLAINSGYQVELEMPHSYSSMLPAIRQMVQRLCPRPPGMSSSFQSVMQDAATSLVMMAISMPRLTALELTAAPPPVVACVRAALEEHCAGVGREVIQVWDLAQGASISAAVSMMEALDAGRSQAAELAGVQPFPQLRSAVALAVRCAINCSSPSRSTPLHLAAERGDARTAKRLLGLSAQPDVRDTSGCTALFLACEAGQVEVVRVLLASKADVHIKNAAGESPLYIAALRGHIDVVQALLSHCNSHGLQWQEPKLYGDCWTPLMAAAVADRHDVAMCLLLAAGPQGKEPLVNAVNRYGQSVLHIAARKGSRKLLRLLLSSGGVASVAAPDASGDTPMDVAKKNRHSVALAEFMRVAAMA